jgi:uncharacterized delta-60 repeat protein
MSKSIQCLYLISIFILPTISSAQEWVARYNGPGNGYDVAYAIVLDSYGNIYVTGTSTGTETSADYATVKYDSSGVEQWVARYNYAWDAACAIAIDASGNIYVTGTSGGAGYQEDYATVKYNSSGVEQWVARYNGPGNGNDIAHAIAVDNAGNIYVTGESMGIGTSANYATVKYDSLGVEKWVARYDGPGYHDDIAYAIALDNAGNIYVTGGSSGLDIYRDYATVKYDPLGIEQWVARYNGAGNQNDNAYAIALDNAGNIYVTGASRESDTDDDYATVKYDSSGVEQWVARYNGPDSLSDRAHAIAVDASDNIYVTGVSYHDYATVKYNSSGVERWVARYNGMGNGNDEAYAIVVDNAGNIYVTGESTVPGSAFDYTTLKYDSLGIEQWVARYDGPCNGWDAAYAIATDFYCNVYITGGSEFSYSNVDYATIKYSSTGVEEKRVTRISKSCFEATILSGHLPLPEGKKCNVFDITGRLVEPTKIVRGIYFIEIDGVVTQKVVKVR